jgi:integrase/recombinase XerD
MAAPIITIFVRHSAGCKYAGDEFTKRCDCKKHLRWTHNGTQHRRATGVRSWAEAEDVKRRLDDELAGRVPQAAAGANYLRDAVAVFIKDKEVQGVSASVLGKYTLELSRLSDYCEARGTYTAQGVTRELLTSFCGTWPDLYPSSVTRAKARERLRSFLRYCYEAQWLERIPVVPKMKMDEPETQPLTADEYARLLAAVSGVVASGDPRRKTNRNEGRRSPDEEEKTTRMVRTFLQLMRWSGLAIRDALTLHRDTLHHSATKGLYRITTKRAKTGTPVSVPIPADVAKDLLALKSENPEYFFWSGQGKPQSATSNWGQRYIAPVFKAAGITSEGNMLSHRLRDTFAVDLLEKGVPMEEVSRLLGHTSIRTTEKSYAKWSKGRQDRVDALVIGTWATRAKQPRKRAARVSGDWRL